MQLMVILKSKNQGIMHSCEAQASTHEQLG